MQLQIAMGTSGAVYAAYGAGLARAIKHHVPADRAASRRRTGPVRTCAAERRRVQVPFMLADTAYDAVSAGDGFATDRCRRRAGAAV